MCAEGPALRSCWPKNVHTASPMFQDFCTQIDMLQPGILGAYEQFGDKYCGKLVPYPGGKQEYK